MAWGWGTTYLRDILVPHGWAVGRTKNFETVIHPSGRHAIAITSANQHAGRTADGRTNSELRTRYKKGEMMADAVSSNAQMSLASIIPLAGLVPEPVDEAKLQTWLLLHYYDREQHTIRAELSLPDAMHDGWIYSWDPRIMLQPITFSPDVKRNDDNGDDGIEIDVRRRQ